MDVQSHLERLIGEVEKNPRIHIFRGTKIEKVDGLVGNFKTDIKTHGELKTIDHGVVIVATGGEEYRPSEFLYGQDTRITTQMDLEREMVLHPESIRSLKNVVMIQCVGSRNEERPYCSRICCSEAIKNALMLKQINPDINVYLLYRDIRTYGFKEDFYEKAREAGVLFLRYDQEKEPRVEKGEEGLEVFANNPFSMMNSLSVLILWS
jgi:heterodisulfide reductase subunit A